MHPKPDAMHHWRRLDRAGWLLWGLTFVLLLALTATLPVLYVSLRDVLGQADEDTFLHSTWVTTVSLVGLVLLFILYTVTKQREIIVKHRTLDLETREHQDLNARFSEILALFQVTSNLHMQIDLDLVLEIIVRRVVSTLRAQQASVMIWDPDAQELVTRAAYGLEAELSRGSRQRMGQGIAGRVASSREAVLLGIDPPDAETGRFYKPSREITSALSLPLAIGDRIVGVLNVNRINHPETFSRRHLDVLQLFGEHIAAVIERAQVVERLGTRTRQLEADNEKLADLNRMKDVFLSTASHELKTPLSSVIAYAELLDDNEGKLTPEQSREFLGRLRGEAMRLLGLIEDILDLSRLESGKLALKTRAVSLDEVARGALETSRVLAERAGVTLVAEFDGALPAQMLDEVKIRQVVVNLLVNAVKFSRNGDTVTLRTRVDGRFIRLEVGDQGPGVPPEQATHIFELFGQGPGEEHGARGGLGIGLHLVKRLTELHGGHVGVLSRAGAGSTFWIRLPMPIAQPVEEPQAQAA